MDKEKQLGRCNLSPIDMRLLRPLLGVHYHWFPSASVSHSLSNTLCLYYSLLISIQLWLKKLLAIG